MAATYGFGETTNNFEAFTATQQAAVRSILQMYSAVINVYLHRGDRDSVRPRRSAVRRVGCGGQHGLGVLSEPRSAQGGDAWFNNSTNRYDNPVMGNYAWLTMMHEIGHALGLKHPHEASGSFAAMPADRDFLEYTVMSYRSDVGAGTGGYTNGGTSYPQSLMMYDIAALQTMYGANYTTNSGNSVYRWSATTGEMSINGVAQGAPAGNKIFLTVWDGGGNDTYDFSNYTTNCHGQPESRRVDDGLGDATRESHGQHRSPSAISPMRCSTTTTPHR